VLNRNGLAPPAVVKLKSKVSVLREHKGGKDFVGLAKQAVAYIYGKGESGPCESDSKFFGMYGIR